MSNIVQFNRELKRVLQRTKRPYLDKAPAMPFVKWAGGKRTLIPEIAKYFPERVSTYWEPFVGGGAVFFTMADRIDRAVLSDLNEELVLTYQVVKDRVDELIEALKAHERGHRNEKHYLQVRAQEPDTSIGIAARFIYLNKTCYNGLYRVNKAGKFNVPKGRYKNPDICNADKLRTASKVLAKATIQVGDFVRAVHPNANDFVYCDPPYHETFTGYQAGGFTPEDQERLRDAINGWINMGANVMLSNSDTSLIRRLYRGGKAILHETVAPRLINSQASKRGPVSELIITSYE